MENQELNNRIKVFFRNKNFENPFIQDCITEFIERHMKLYGDVISADELFKRLEDNLDRITFAGREKAPNGELGEYKGRIADNTDLNEIFIYFNEADLELSETDKKMWSLYTGVDREKLLQDVSKKKAEIKSTLMHELTHSAYTIKDEYGMGEKHIFSKTSKDFLSGEYRQIGGNNNYVEAIVNYIASRIEGKTPEQLETYQAETQVIYMLAEKVDESSIIQSAWASDEQQFKQAYISAIAPQSKEIGENSYNAFQEGMKRLVLIRGQNISISENLSKNKETLTELQQILDGKSIELKSSNFRSIPHIQHIGNTEPESISKPKENLPFSQRIARFLSNHTSLMNVPFIKKFVDKQLNALPPATSQCNLNNRRIAFINELSNNGEYLNLAPIQKKEKTPTVNKTNEQVIDDNAR